MSRGIFARMMLAERAARLERERRKTDPAPIPWEARFRADMEALGCRRIQAAPGLEEKWHVPVDAMDAVRGVIEKYTDPAVRGNVKSEE